MEEQETPSPEYVKGFNEGYTIAQHAPELSKQFGDIKSDNPRMVGFQAGREQAVQEKDRERYPAWLTGHRESKAEPDNTKDRTKDRDIEPER